MPEKQKAPTNEIEVETNFQCGICAKLFSSEADIDLHILNDHNEKDEDSMAHFHIMEETNREKDAIISQLTTKIKT